MVGLLSGLVLAALLGTARHALAEDPSVIAAPHAVMRERSGFTFDVRVFAGAARARFTERDRPVADFDAVTAGGALRFGWFLGQRVLLGAELVGSWHGSMGELRVRDADYFSTRGVPRRASYLVAAPLGLFVEVYPLPARGLYASLGGALGFIDLPRLREGATGLASGCSLELGYELSGDAKLGPAPLVRYSYWAGEESPFSSEHPQGLTSHELLLGLRWSFWTPEWR